MKKLYLTLFLLCALFAGCSDSDDSKADRCDMLWDFMVYNIMFTVSDSEGNDLLNPETTGYIDPEGITVSYKSETYTVESPTKDYLPTWHGLRKLYSEKNDRYYLLFGEFSPTDNYKKEAFTVAWGDGTKDNIAFDMYITWDKCDPAVHRKAYLNNKPVSNEKSPYLVPVVK